MKHWMLALVLLLSGALGVALGLPDVEAKKDPAFEKSLLKIGEEYQSYGLVDDEGRWAPFLCRRPNPGRSRYSKAGKDSGHTRKIYYLFAKKREAYIKVGAPSKKKAESHPVGQVLVKESWKPKEVKKAVEIKPVHDKRGTYVPYVKKGKKLYHADKQAGLFIMMKLAPKTPGTDEGWVYATLSADGTKVTASGKIASCMKCHKEAAHDRLFGLD